MPLPCARMGLARLEVLQVFRGILPLSVASNTPAGFPFPKENCCKKHDMRDEGGAEGTVLCNSFHS